MSVDDGLQTEKGGYVLDASAFAPSEHPLKTASDGHTLLIPQPSEDPNDPLNWSSTKKHLFLFIIAVAAFLPDYGSSTGAITNLVQPESVRPLLVVTWLLS
jgi:hypothetical protein